MKILNKIQESIYPPNDKNLLWLDINDCNKAVLKYHHNCKWIKISDESFLIDALKVLVDKNTEDIKKEKDEREKVDDFIYKLIGSDVYINGTGVQGLETEVKTNLIGALNKIDETIGRLSNLDIDIKTEDNSPNNIISALNILKKLLDDEITRAKSVEGNLDDLDTTNNTNLVEAINELKSDLSTVYRIKGSSKLDALPTGDNVKVGDVYNIIDSGTIDINGETIVILPGDNVVYTDNGWDKLNASIDTSLYQEKLTTSNEGYGIKITPDNKDSKKTAIEVNIPNYKDEPYETTQTEEGVKVTTIEEKINTKQDKLTDGDYISIDDNNNISCTLIAGDNITITPDDNGKYEINTKYTSVTSSDGTVTINQTNDNYDLSIKDKLDTKQDKLTAGTDISIKDNVISVNIPEYKDKIYELKNDFPWDIHENQYPITFSTNETGKLDKVIINKNKKSIVILDGTYASYNNYVKYEEGYSTDSFTFEPNVWYKIKNGNYTKLEGNPEVSFDLNNIKSYTFETGQPQPPILTDKQTIDKYLPALKNTINGYQTFKEKFDTKQDKLKAGDGISIDNNVISNMFELSSDDDSVKLGSSKTFGYDLSIPFKIKSNTEDNSNVLALNSFKLPLATSFKIETKDIDIIFTLTNCEVYDKDTDSCCTTWEITATDNSKIPPIYLSEGGILVDRVVNNDEGNLGFSIYTPDTNIYIDSIKEYTAISYLDTNDNVFNFEDCGDDFIADFKTKNKVCVPNKFSTNVPYFEVVSNDITITKQLALKDDLLDYKKHIDTEIKEKLTKVYKIKGSVEKFEFLPFNAEIGDVYNVSKKIEKVINSNSHQLIGLKNYFSNTLNPNIYITLILEKEKKLDSDYSIYYIIIENNSEDYTFISLGASSITRYIEDGNTSTFGVGGLTSANENVLYCSVSEQRIELRIESIDEIKISELFIDINTKNGEQTSFTITDSTKCTNAKAWTSDDFGNKLPDGELPIKTYPANTNFVWTGEEWDSLGGMFDFKEIEDTPLEEKDIIKIFTNNQIP